jgi:predicted dienelactone hydrolase
MIGHSFGGYTALALAGARLNPPSARLACSLLDPLERSPADWLQCAVAELPYKQMSFRDYRIDRVIVFNPIIGDLFDRDLAAITLPLLMLSSTEDGITPIIDHQLQPFDRLHGEKYLIVADGATHMSVTDLGYLDSAMGQSTLVREVMDDRANSLRQMLKGVSLAFIQQSTPFANLYRPYLSPTYVESFTNDFIRPHLTRSLPSPISTALMLLSFNRPSLQTDPPLPRWSGLEKPWIVFTNGIAPNDFQTETLGSVFRKLLRYSDRAFASWE